MSFIWQKNMSCWTSFSENSPSLSVNENWLKQNSPRKTAQNILQLPGPPNTEMPKFKITTQGVTKLHDGLNGGKAYGPDEHDLEFAPDEYCQRNISLS